MQNNRAKQFLPFDALKGFKEALRMIENGVEVEEDIIINKIKNLKINQQVSITYFIDDRIIDTIGLIKQINLIKKYIIISNSKIYFNDIITIEY